MTSYFDHLKPKQDQVDKSMSRSFRGDFSPTKPVNRSQNRTMSSIQQGDQSNSDHYSIDILKPDAVKAIIREEIVNKGYDTIDFAQFLAKFQREKGPIDDRWTLVKLLEAVISFKACNSPATLSDDESFTASIILPNGADPRDSFMNGMTDHFDESRSHTYFEANDDERDRRRGTVLVPENPYKDKVYVKKLEPNQLSKQENVSIIIEEAQISKGGIFSSDYLSYKIKTSPFGWVVQRRTDEFIRLRSLLEKLHPGIVIPKIAKKVTKEKFKDDSIRKRIYLYERFLQNCLESSDIKCTKIFCDFLAGNDKGFLSSITKFERSVKINKVEDLKNSTGEILIDVTPDLAVHAELVDKHFSETEKVYKDLKKLSKKLGAELSLVSNTLLEIGDKYLELNSLTVDFNSKAKVGPSKLDGMFLELNKNFKNWSEQIQSQITSIRKNLGCFYTYAVYEVQTFRERNQTRLKLQCDYERVEKEVRTKKERLFQAGDTDKWELDAVKSRGIPREELLKDKDLAFAVMLTKESQQLRKMKDQYGFLNFATYNEMLRNFNSMHDIYIENFKDFIKRQVDSTSQIYSNWADFVTYMKMSNVPDASSPGVRKPEPSIRLGGF